MPDLTEPLTGGRVSPQPKEFPVRTILTSMLVAGGLVCVPAFADDIVIRVQVQPKPKAAVAATSPAAAVAVRSAPVIVATPTVRYVTSAPVVVGGVGSTVRSGYVGGKFVSTGDSLVPVRRTPLRTVLFGN